MEINMLLEGLIEVAGKPKTDFAISMNMTPSGLSKILTGKRIPIMRERNEFARQTAEYFAEAIYCPGCYAKLKNIFPLLYDFETMEELRGFLVSAVEYALDGAFAAENNVDINRLDRGMYFSGEEVALNMLCIILSDYVPVKEDDSLEIYGGLEMLHSDFSSVFGRLRILAPERYKNVVFNIFYDEEQLRGLGSKFFAFLTRTQDVFQINLWEWGREKRRFFLLLKGKAALHFNNWIDDSIIMIPVTNRGYLAMLYNTVMGKGAKKVSYSRKEAVSYLEEHPGFVKELLDKGVDFLYNFVSVGYLLERQELDEADAGDSLKDAVYRLLNGALVQSKAFVVSYGAMERFIATGNIIAPFVGIVNYPEGSRLPYLQRYTSYLGEEVYQSVKIVKIEMANMAVLCAEGTTLVYTIDRHLETERIHVLPSGCISSMLYQKTLGKKNETMNFTRELWEAYQERLLERRL